VSRFTPQQAADALGDGYLDEYDEDLKGWATPTAKDGVLHIKMTPVDDEGDADIDRAEQFCAVVVAGDLPPIVVERPNISNPLKNEGVAYGETGEGWQVVPYSTTRGHCEVEAADSVLSRMYGGTVYGPCVQQALTPAEARRNGAALIALADAVEDPELQPATYEAPSLVVDCLNVQRDDELGASLVHAANAAGDQVILALDDHWRSELVKALTAANVEVAE
jgi:hypothetical protein